MPLLNTPNSENQAINTPLSEQKPAKFEKSRLGPVYSDLRICQLTLEEIQRRGRFIVPDDCRELIELATHPDRLDQCAARSSVWQTHGEKMDGRGYRHQSIADKACIHRTDDWQSERLTSAWELDEEAATRLGVRDCRVRVDWPSALQPEPDQQLERVSAINVPGHWIFNIDFEAVRVTGEWEITAGTEVFRYSRSGFQRR